MQSNACIKCNKFKHIPHQKFDSHFQETFTPYHTAYEYGGQDGHGGHGGHGGHLAAWSSKFIDYRDNMLNPSQSHKVCFNITK